MKQRMIRPLAAVALMLVLLLMGSAAAERSSALETPRSNALAQEMPQSAPQDVPETLIPAEFDEWTVGGGYIYWATNCFSIGPDGLEDETQVPDNHYALHRWPLGGGTPETLVIASHTNCNTFRFLTADDDGVYYWNDSLNRLMNYPIERAPGQGAIIVRENINSVTNALHLDSSSIYYANSSGRIRRVAKNGSSNVQIHDTGSFVNSMAVDRDRNDIYWINGSGLWYGRKNCSTPPCGKLQLSSATGDYITLGASGVAPRTVYMVRSLSTKRVIRSFDCQVTDTSSCTVREWRDTSLSSLIGPPAWTSTGFIRPKDWLVWFEWSSSGGRLMQLELNPSVVPDPTERYSGDANLTLKTIISGSQIYFANREPGNERIMRLPLSGEPPPRDFGDLAQVNNPELNEDWRRIARVESQWDERPNYTALCTGTLVDPGIVITAGACVFDKDQGDGWADSVRVIPAYEDGDAPFGDAYGAQLWAFDGFQNNGAANDNIGWIKLDRPVGALTGWYKFSWQETLYLWLSTFNNPGYPRAGFDNQFMYNRSGHFSDILAERFIHNAEVANMKGSPALILDDDTVYGIESRMIGAENTTSAYARLTEAKVTEIAGTISNNTPTAVDLVPLKFRVPANGGLAAGTWPTSESFILHNYSTAQTAANQSVTLKMVLSDDDRIEGSDTLLATGSFQIAGNLKGRENFVVSGIEWDGTPAIPLDTAPGDYWLGIILDEADAVPANNATHGWDATAVNILPPQMSVTPGTLSASADSGDPPVEETVTVDILGDGAGNPEFDWTGTPNASWLSITPSSGTDGQEVTVIIDAAGLGAGTYHGQVNFATDLRDGSGIPVASAAVEVTLNVAVGAAEWQPEPAEMNFEAVAGSDNPPAQALLIKATVDYPFNWIVEDGSPVTDDAPWLPVNSGAGTAPGLFNVAPDISGLAPGAYSTQLATHSPGLDNYVLTTVNLTVHEAAPPQPVLQVSPLTLFYEAMSGGSNPGPDSFTISNIGTGQLNWTAGSDDAWLNLSQSSGSGEAQVSVGISTAGLAPGTHVGQITVADGAGSEQVVRVVLQLSQPPTMVIDGSYLVFNGLSGQTSPPPGSFTVRNAGTGSFDWLTAESIDWLAVNPTQGSAPAQVGVQADTSGLDAGARQGTITVSSPTALNSPQEVDVRLFLRQGPVLATAPQVLSFNAAAGEPAIAPQPITVANVSRGQMNWTAESSAGWLKLGQTAGVTGPFSSTAVNVNVDTAGLSARDEAYVGQITVRSDNGEASPQTITVFLNVTSPARFCNIPNGGQGFVVNSRNAKIRFTDVQRTLTADGGCDFSATLRAALPQNASLQSKVAGHVDSNNLFVPTSSSPLTLKVAMFSLQLSKEFTISDEFGLKALGGQWKLPSEFGGRSKNFNGAIQINAQGISLAGAGKFDLPDIDYGALRLRKLKGEVAVAADWSYVVTMSGDMEIGITGGGTTIQGIELRLDQRGFRSGEIGSFTVKDIAGVDIEVLSANFDSKKIRADKAILKIPKEWGGAEGALYGLEIDFNGNLRVTGGRFKLPSINAGGDSFKLSSLEGEFRSVTGGYEIQARGEFGMRGFGDSGGCTLIVDVTIFSDNGASVLAIDSVDGQQLIRSANGENIPFGTDAAAGIGLRELTLGIWDCQPGLPIGPTGFELTGVKGTIKLRASLEEVGLKLQIQSIARLGPVPFIRIEPQATLRPDPFFLGYSGPAFMTNIEFSDTTGMFEKGRFSAQIILDYKVLHGEVGINAGRGDDGDFELGGSGQAEVGVEKGSVFEKCKFGICVPFPPYTLTVAEAKAEVNLRHIYGSIKVLGIGVAFEYSFETGDIDFSRALLTQMISSQEISQARAFRQSGVGTPPEFDAQIDFSGSDSVTLILPVPASIPALEETAVTAAQPAALAADAVQSDAVFILAQPAGGQLSFVLIDPNGQEYTPANLAENMQFQQVLVDGMQHMLYSVSQAQPGQWQTRVEGDVNGTDFAVVEHVNIAQGVLENLRLSPTGSLNEVEFEWQHLAQEATPRIKIFANAYETTQDISYTDANGVLVTGTTDKFIGQQVAEISSPPTDGTLQSVVVDLSGLPSGSYAFWIEAEGIETSGVRCYVRQSGSGCSEPVGNLARFTVDHSSTFPTAWDPGLAVDMNIKDGLLLASWDEAAHPDVDSYLLTVVGEDVPQAGQDTTAEISVPAERDASGRVTAALDNIEPGRTYRLMVKAIDEDGDRSVDSPELLVMTPQPEFDVSSPTTDAVVQAGGQPQTVTINLEMSSNLPHDPLLFVDYDRLPDGVIVEFGAESVAGRPTASTTARISASSGLPPGSYVVPIVARSGELERMLNLPLEVTPWQPSSIKLPAVFR